MKQYKILHDDPILSEKALPVESITPDHRDMARSMVELLKKHNGIGLAAPQIGVSIQMIVVYIKQLQKKPVVMYNPEIISTDDGSETDNEGCLSFPDVVVEVKRANTIKVKYMDSKGKPAMLKASGILARCIQHEIDHLHGITLLDYE